MRRRHSGRVPEATDDGFFGLLSGRAIVDEVFHCAEQ